MFRKTAIIKTGNPVIEKLNAFFSSEYAVGALAFCSVCSAFLGLELFFYSLVCLAGIYVCLFGRDFRFFVAAALCSCTAISQQNNPNTNPASPIYPWNGFWIVIALGVMLAVLLLWRISRMGKAFFALKRKFSFSLILLGVSFIVGSFGSMEYLGLNLRYSALLFLSLFALYYVLTATVEWRTVKKEYFAWVLFFLACSVCGQLMALYLGGQVIVDGQIVRSKLYVGWGTYNNLSLMILLGMPASFYLATVRKKGFVFNLFGNYFYLCVVLSNSRTCMLTGAIVYFLCMYFVLHSRNNYRANLIVYECVLLLFTLLFVFFGEEIIKLFWGLITKGADSNGRDVIYEKGAVQFFASPIIGKGFFASNAYGWWTVAGANLIPPLWHNTFIQMLASCGLCGLFAYGYHRVQTFWHFFEGKGKENLFLGVCLLAFLLTNVLDCHFFLLGPGLFYSAYLAVAENTGTGMRAIVFRRKIGEWV